MKNVASSILLEHDIERAAGQMEKSFHCIHVMYLLCSIQYNLHILIMFTDSRDSKNPTANKEGAGTIKGELKLTLEYRRQALHVMVCHAKNLANPDGSGKEPNSYVKVYLRPDPLKDTKRNTRVVKKNCHPSFMEPVSYFFQKIF